MASWLSPVKDVEALHLLSDCNVFLRLLDTGKALKSKRESYQVATKFGFIFEEFTPGMDGIKGISGAPDFVRQQVENSLKRLGTDHIDL